MKRQIVAVAVNGIKVIIDKKTDPRNIELFSKISAARFYIPKK